MKPLPATPELLWVARRVVWFDEPAQALADPAQFLAHVMVFGTSKTCGRCAESSARMTIARCWNRLRPAFSTRGHGPIGIWFAAAIRRRHCRCAPDCTRSGA